MGKRSDAYLRGVPMKRYDMVREGFIVLGVVTFVIVLLAALLGIANSPNADLIAGLIAAAAFLILIFLPAIPGLNRIPHLIPV